jgi:hypothetical protein
MKNAVTSLYCRNAGLITIHFSADSHKPNFTDAYYTCACPVSLQGDLNISKHIRCVEFSYIGSNLTTRSNPGHNFKFKSKFKRHELN